MSPPSRLHILLRVRRVFRAWEGHTRTGEAGRHRRIVTRYFSYSARRHPENSCGLHDRKRPADLAR